MSEDRLTNIDRNLHEVSVELAGVNARLDGHDERFVSIDGRFDAVDRRFDGIDRRLDGLEDKFDRTLVKFESLQDQIQIIAEAQSSLTETVKRGFADIPRQIAEALVPYGFAINAHAGQLVDHETRIEKLEAR